MFFIFIFCQKVLFIETYNVVDMKLKIIELPIYDMSHCFAEMLQESFCPTHIQLELSKLFLNKDAPHTFILSRLKGSSKGA